MAVVGQIWNEQILHLIVEFIRMKLETEQTKTLIYVLLQKFFFKQTWLIGYFDLSIEHILLITKLLSNYY